MGNKHNPPEKEAAIQDGEAIVNEEEIIEEPSHIWRTILKYGITFLVATGLVFAVFGINGLFTTPDMTQAELYRKLSDGFTVPGLFFILLALLVFVSKKGAFTGLGYALRHVARMILPFLVRKDISYAEYLEAKEKRKSLSIVLCFIIIGTLFLIVGIVFIFIFYKYY